ncbi:hypothetical protein [Salinicola sp. DM10]|uniref:hypothetical protein n=1 Tax=Salinicola sp. DM10 TaxID=2815721 RepID=UPI0004E65760|nr:hypothetical protein [Salinicola sp. DM10]KFF49986.1 hypothetical protein GY26_04765 [Gammaproteobacteria bacterium MFB021]MCE3026397.1 hypothetical protein [Salinicola sp. DM10]
MTTTKKQPVRVFLDQSDHSRFLVQAGTNRLTPSALGERLMQYGLSLLESGDRSPLAGTTNPARPDAGA